MFIWRFHISLSEFSIYCIRRYGAILEKFQKQDSSLMRRVKGCIVDSAPVAAADPTVSDGSCIALFIRSFSRQISFVLGL